MLLSATFGGAALRRLSVGDRIFPVSPCSAYSSESGGLSHLGLTQLLVEALVFMSWRAAVGGEAIPQMMGETASAVIDRLAVI